MFLRLYCCLRIGGDFSSKISLYFFGFIDVFNFRFLLFISFFWIKMEIIIFEEQIFHFSPLITALSLSLARIFVHYRHIIFPCFVPKNSCSHSSARVDKGFECKLLQHCTLLQEFKNNITL